MHPSMYNIFAQPVLGQLLSTKLQPTIFADHMPRLKTLTLGFFTEWPGNHFCNLTKLCLVDQRNDTSPSRTYSHFLGIIDASPLLEELVLVNAVILTDDRPASGSLRLPRLRTLVMSEWPGDAPSMSLVLSDLELPETCAVVAIRYMLHRARQSGLSSTYVLGP